MRAFCKGCFKLASVSVLLGVTTYFGIQQLPAEMGISVVAGALGLAFANLDKISEFKGAGFSAKMRKVEVLADQIEAVVDKETEEQIERDPEKIINVSGNVSASPSGNEPSLSSGEVSILRALLNPKYTWRTRLGLTKEANMGSREIDELIRGLIDQGLVRHSVALSKGDSIYALTSYGRSYAKSQGIKSS